MCDSDSSAKIILTARVHQPVADTLSRHGHVVMPEGPEPWPRDVLLGHCSDGAALMAFMHDRVDAELLDAAPPLRIVAGALKGYDNIDVAACTSRGVWVSIVPDLLTEPTAELTVGLMIGLGRHILAGDRHVRSGGFTGWRPRFYGTGLRGSRVGILGMGAIGRAIAQRLLGFDAEVRYWDRRPLTPREEAACNVWPIPQDELLAESDFLIVALPLTPDTTHLLDAHAIGSMKRGAYLINPSRGSVVDERAVADALARDHLAGYAADVFEFEDWARADRSAAVNPDILAMSDRTLLTPHLGSAVASVRRQIEEEAAANIIDALEGRPPRGAINQPASAAHAAITDGACGRAR